MNEEDVRMKLINPALESAGWKGERIRPEYTFTDGQIIVQGKRVSRGNRKRADYLLTRSGNDFPLAVIEAKDSQHRIGDGLQQAESYARALGAPFAYSSNGSGFVEHDLLTGKITHLEMSAFPMEETLWARYLAAKGLTPEEEKVISQPYHFNSLTKKQPRYYQRRAVDAAVEAVAVRRVLYLAGRNILINQTMRRDFSPLANVMVKVQNSSLDSSYEVYMCLYQQLTGEKDAPQKPYMDFKPDFFDLVIVDECHRGSAAEDSQTNLLLHGIDAPEFYHGNSLERNVRELDEEDRFDIILMNPPYGGTEQRSVQANFPAEMRSSETADLFMALATYRLKKNGRAAIIIPDGFLFGTDGPKTAIKKRLLENLNLHTVVRLPSGVFSPYTSITTNILFFENKGKTDKTWFYRVDMPKGYKHFSKTRPMLREHFVDCEAWWQDRREIQDEGTDTFKAGAYNAEELAARGYDFDLCGYLTEAEEVC